MSRRSAVATDTGTTGATFARAEDGLGSPPQPTPHRLSKTMSAVASRGNRRTSLDGSRSEAALTSRVASGLQGAVVIGKPLCAEKHDKFCIIVICAEPKGWTFPPQLRLLNIAPRQDKTVTVDYRAKSILSSNKRSTCDLYKDLPSLTDSYAERPAGRRVATPSIEFTRAGASTASRVYCGDFTLSPLHA